MIFTLVAMIIAWSLTDWIIYGSQWMQRMVYATMDSAMWTPPKEGEAVTHAQRRTMIASMLITIYSAFLFTVFGEWMGLAALSSKSALMVALLIWGAFVVPFVLLDRLYFRMGTRYALLQLVSWGFKIGIATLIFSLRT